jgi:peptidoglycan hydrolase-like protein with peptidoglycan-binding domain
VPQEETPTPTTTAPTQQTDALPPVGQVLGDSTFFFATNMFYGMRNNDVTELQDRLSEEGFYGGPITGFFGNLTRGAVIRYQKVHNITPAVGYVGPLTRNALNTATNAAPSTSQQQASAAGAFSAQQASAVQARINQLMELVRNLILQLK